MRIQLALNVSDLEKAVAYYSKLFGVAPHKRKPGYANFAIDQPPLKLVLFENPAADERLNHLGVEALEEAEVEEATGRLQREGIAAAVERDTTCCFATQNKVWSTDPDGMRWEWYRVLADSDAAGPTPREADPAESQEAPTPNA